MPRLLYCPLVGRFWLLFQLYMLLYSIWTQTFIIKYRTPCLSRSVKSRETLVLHRCFVYQGNPTTMFLCRQLLRRCKHRSKTITRCSFNVRVDSTSVIMYLFHICSTYSSELGLFSGACGSYHLHRGGGRVRTLHSLLTQHIYVIVSSVFGCRLRKKTLSEGRSR